MPPFRTFFFNRVKRLSRSQKKLCLALVDVVLAPISFLLAFGVMYETLPDVAFFQTHGAVLLILAGLGGAFSVALKMPNIKLNSYEAHGILRTGAMTLLVAGSLTLVVAALGVAVPRLGIILFGLFFFLSAVALRFAMLHTLLWVLRADQPRQRVLIYGAGKTGEQLLAALRSHDSIWPVAFVDDNPALHNLSSGGLHIYGSDRILELTARLGVDRILLAMPSVCAPKLAQIACKLQVMGLTVMSVPSFAQITGVERLVDTLTLIEPDTFLGRMQVGNAMPLGTEAYQGRTILVSGAGGSVGAALCRKLLSSKPACIVLYEASEFALYTVERALSKLAADTGTRLQPILGSISDSRLARTVMVEHKVEVVFHAAAYKHVPLVEANPISGLANNVLGTRSFADAAIAAGVQKFVLISTDKAVRPTNVMGASKRMAELVIQDLAKRTQRTAFSMVRFGNVLGSSGSVIPLFKDQIAKGEAITLTHEDVTRYFMTLSEAARLVLLAGSFSDARCGGDVFVLDMGEPVRIRDLAEQMIQAAGLTVCSADRPDGDIEIIVTGLRPGEKLHEELLIGQGLLPTPHPKILRAEEQSLTELQMATALQALRAAVETGDVERALGILHSCVEGYGDPLQGIAAQ
ncbi:polysaccharide biosynthesis protein [Pseudorhodobacter ferrugineus]|uniref:polysaccharide biosynthesis protein n=1 Tax=Pseudorhodobacter ferrugineus TaxID=77008 RepID=UPI0005278366|nr:nucleoside-diphosphate sugar epimerase/dehydratase [Pseudorhodobacter ferrugineus]